MKRSRAALSSALTVSALLCASTASQAQDYWNPLVIDPRQGPVYDEATELLHIPVVILKGLNGERERVYDAQLRHTGDFNFKLEATRELSPLEECTEAEVRAAIPQLHLDMEVAEVSALVGCEARISILGTDLETGRLVQASWMGLDGVSNTVTSPAGFASGVITYWRPIESMPEGAYVSAGPAPSITFQLREGVVESYTYHVLDASNVCADETLGKNYTAVAIGDDMDSVIGKLGCSPQQRDVIVDAEGSMLLGNWLASTGTPGGAPSRSRVSVALTFEEGSLVAKRKRVTSRESWNSICGVDEMMAAYPQLQEGQSRESLLTNVGCQPMDITTTQDDESLTQTYVWRSGEYESSVFESPNRFLSVTVIDGVIAEINFSRI